MIQPLPRTLANVGYGTADQEIGILDGNTSGVFVGRYAPMPAAGSVRSLTLYRAAGLPEVTIEVYIEGVATGLTVTLGTGDEQGYIEGDAPYDEGDYVTLKSSTTLQLFPGFRMGACVEIESDVLCFGVAATGGGGAYLANHYGGALGNGVWAENRSNQSICAIAGTATRLSIRRQTTNVGGSWKAWLEISPSVGTTPVLQDGTGGTIDTLVEMPDTGPALVFKDFELPCTPGQYVNVVLLREIEPGFSSEQVGVGVAFTPDTPGQFMLVGGSTDAIWTTETTSWKWNKSEQLAPTEASHTAPVGRSHFAITGIHVEHTDFPGVGQTYTDTVLRNSVASDVAVVLSGGAERFANATGREDYAPGDLVTIDITRSASASAAAKFYWGLAAELVGIGTLIVEKIAAEDPDQDFDIAAGGGLDPDTITLKDGESYTFEDVPAGSYSLEETLPDGWALAEVVVSNDPSNNDPSNITIADGETVTVTFTNQTTVGTIVVEKSAPDDPTRDFSMLASEPLSPESFTLRDGESRTFEDVPAGDGYFISELVPPGWTVEAVVSNGSPLDNISVAAGELVTVSLVNTMTACECCVATKIKIINAALFKLGHSQTIALLTEATREAYTGNFLFDDTLKELLRAYPWAFATKYADSDDNLAGYMDLVDGSLSDPAVRRSIDNATEWQYAYRYPLDCLFARRIVPPEGRKFDRHPIPFRKGRDDDGLLIYTNEPDAVLEYTALVECSENFADQLFEDALSWLLASKMAPSLSRNGKTATECWGMHKDVLNQAGAVDAKEQQQEPDGPAVWIEDRG